MDVLTNSYLNFGSSITNSTEDFFSNNRPGEDAQAVLERLQPNHNNTYNDVNLDNFLKAEKGETGDTVETVETGVVATSITTPNAFQPYPQPSYAIVPVGEKNDMISKDQLYAMIDSGNQLNMNGIVNLNFDHEGKPFGLKLSVFLQLLLHQAAYAYWMGKKSAPTASRNCKFEGAAKGQTKYPKRKFCGWVNKVAEVTKSYGNEDLCTALQELWSLLRLSPAELDCKQNENIKRIVHEFFRIHAMLIGPGSNPTISQLWTQVLTSAAKPEVFMKRDTKAKSKSKAKSPSPAPEEFVSPAKKLKTVPVAQLPPTPATQQLFYQGAQQYNPAPMGLYPGASLTREIPLGILPLPTTNTTMARKRPLE